MYLFALLAAVSASAAEPTLRYAEDRAPAIVNPLFATSMAEARLNELVFESLFSDDHDLRSAPQLAERFELSDDKTSMTLHLRHGVRWHDGKPFDADDVVFTINAMQDAGTASTEAGRAAWIASATATDAHTLQLSFAAPEHAPQDKLHFKILPEHRFEGLPIKRTDPFRNRPMGTGPWTVQAFNEDSSISLARNADHWREASLPGLSMREVSDKNYQSKLLIYKSLDLLVRVLPRDLAPLQNDREVRLYPYQTNSWWYVGFNHKDSRLSDKRLREALSLLVDVPELLRPIGTGQLVTGPFVVSSPYYDHDVPARANDPDRAGALLREAGYNFDGRHWVDSAGAPLKLRIASQADLETSQDVVINLQSQLQNQGIVVEPKFLRRAEWKQRVWRDRDFDLILSQWSFDRNEDVYEQLHSEGGRNFVGYSSAQVDALLESARDSVDPQVKKQQLRKVHALTAADAPMVFLWTLDNYAAVSTK
ncbi:MAG: peptide/nickel transport system substrate-binding protein, partial [Myxococcota bacterium]